MPLMSRQEVGDVLRSLGFNEVQAAGKFYWFEYPSLVGLDYEQRRAALEKPIVRAQFYEPTSELRVWVYRNVSRMPTHLDVVENVFYDSNVRTLALLGVGERVALIAEDNGAPRGLVKIVRSGDQGGVHVLNDWLLERGVNPF